MKRFNRMFMVLLSFLIVSSSFSALSGVSYAAEMQANSSSSLVFEDFEDMSDVYLTKSVATDYAMLEQSTRPDPAVHGLSAAKLTYDFTGSTATSAAYLRFYDNDGSAGRTIVGSPSKIGFWVYGAGFKHWIRAQVQDANKTQATIDFTTTSTVIDGWQYVSANLPTNLTGPYKLNFIYYVEIGAKTSGTLYFDQISMIYGNTTSLEFQWSNVKPMHIGEILNAQMLETKAGYKMPAAVAANLVTFSSSDQSVAEVAADGMITALAAGTTTLTASYNGAISTYELTVTDEQVESNNLVITGPSTLVPSEDGAVHVYSVFDNNQLFDVTQSAFITSNDEAILAVDGNILRGISYGTATITATLMTEQYGELTASYSLEVKPGELRSIAIKDVFSAIIGGEALSAKVIGTYRIEGEKPITEGVTYSIDNASIATIDADTGVITALTPGVTTVRANVNGQTAQQTLVVTNDISNPKHELRGAWISTVENIDWPTKGDVDPASQREDFIKLLDELQAAGINAIFTQVRPTADSFFPSEYFPWSHWLTGKQGVAPADNYDPLAFMIEEAHKRNMEFHAWVNPFRVSMNTDTEALVETHPARQHPDWIVNYEGKLYFNPGIEEARNYIIEAVNEIVVNYNIDGIHMDDYFYPYPSSQSFNDAEQYGDYTAAGGNLSLSDWRRNNVNEVVSGLHDTIKESKDYVKFGISPFGIWKNKSSDATGSATNGLESYSAIYADTRTWIQEGWVDYIAPQIYWHFGYNAAAYDVLVDWWVNEVNEHADTHDVHLYIGHATYKVGTSGWENEDQLPAQLRYNQGKQGAVDGSILFSSNHFLANPLGILDAIKETYARPALIPEMSWLGGTAPQVPLINTIKSVKTGVQLSWNMATSGEDAAYYTIYRADGNATPNISTSEHLIATVRAVNGSLQFFVDETAVVGETYTYAVAAVSRIHVESEASESSTILVETVNTPTPTPSPGGGGSTEEGTTEEPKEEGGTTEEEVDTPTFNDLSKDHWAAKYIEQLVANKIFTGYADGTIKPNALMTRAEYMTVLYRLYNNKVALVENSTFTDVKQNAWYSEAINQLTHHGFVAGYTDGSFKPNHSITREEAFVMLYRMFKDKLPAAQANDVAFADDAAIAGWAQEAVQHLAAAGIVEGDGSGKLNPKQPITRAEIAKIVSFFLDKK